MFELKKLSREGIPAALKKAERYRLLNEPWEAESICRDVLAADPDNEPARIGLILALTDQFGAEGAPDPAEAHQVRETLSEYQRAYYAGIIFERQAKSRMRRQAPGSGYAAYDAFRQALDWYEKAERLRPEGDDSALLRWNTCARLLNKHDYLRPEPEAVQTMLE